MRLWKKKKKQLPPKKIEWEAVIYLRDQTKIGVTCSTFKEASDIAQKAFTNGLNYRSRRNLCICAKSDIFMVRVKRSVV